MIFKHRLIKKKKKTRFLSNYSGVQITWIIDLKFRSTKVFRATKVFRVTKVFISNQNKTNKKKQTPYFWKNKFFWKHSVLKHRHCVFNHSDSSVSVARLPTYQWNRPRLRWEKHLKMRWNLNFKIERVEILCCCLNNLAFVRKLPW